MKPLHLYVQAKTWQRKVILVALYHNFRCKDNTAWRIEDTRQYFHISKGLCSENLNLWKQWDKVKNCKTRKEALELIK